MDQPTEEVVEVTEPTVENTPAVEVEQTISDMVPEKETENMIPESAFLGEKKARKALEKEVIALKKQIETGSSTEDISDSIDAIAEEHDIDRGFLKKLAQTIKADTEKELEQKFNSKFESREKIDKFETAFNKGLALALERGPEFKDIANPDVIKQLALLPQNASKTISEIIEETYGNAIQGKRTIETTTPGGGKDPEPLDLNRAGKDIEYFNEVMADPKKKAQYNEAMLSKGY